MVDQEKVYYESSGVTITNTRAIFFNTTYALANIASVRIFKEPPSRGPAIMLFLGGIFIGFIGLMMASLVTAAHLITLVGLITMGIAIYLSIKAKPDYIVKVSSSSGEADVLYSKDSGYIQRIVDAINQAIIDRG